MIRYRDGKIVSTKGERFTQVTKEESEELKKSYVSWQPMQLKDIFKIFEKKMSYKNNPSATQNEFQPLILLMAPLWLITYLLLLKVFLILKFKLILISIKEQIR